MTVRHRPLLTACYLAWLTAWFWVFTFGFSSSFFAYHRATRIPVLLLALLAVAVPPLSCRAALDRALKGSLSPLRATLLNLVACAAPLGLFWGVLAAWTALARATGSIAFEADEAMGHGITFMLCAAAALTAVLVVPVMLAGVALWRRRTRRP